MNNNLQLSKLESLLKKAIADYSIHIDNLNIESAEDGSRYYGISLEETA